MHQPEGQKRFGKNLGKAKDSKEERLFNRDEVVAMIPRMTAENARGGHVFVTPIDPAAWHVLIDDLKGQKLSDFRREGYAPAALVETSNGNFQAVLKIAKQGMDEGEVNEFFKAMNRARGDEEITGLTHPMRLAGFQNRKEKHKDDEGHYPYVRLVEAVNRFCQRAVAVVRELAHPTPFPEQSSIDAAKNTPETSNYMPKGRH
jgi:hypothetical protein